MKKYLIFAIVVLVGLISWFGYYAYQRLDQAGFDADIVTYASRAMDEGGITAEVGGQTVAVPAWQLDTLAGKLTTAASYRKPAGENPAGALDTLTIHLGSGSTVTLWKMDKQGDETVLRFVRPGKTYCFSLTGYKLYDWVERILLQA